MFVILLIFPSIFSTLITIFSFLLPTETETIISLIPFTIKVAILLFILICTAISLYSTLKQRNKRYTFDYGSEKFIAFFTRWYSQKGKISIVCEDLDWIYEGHEQKIFNTLYQKAQKKELSLYLTKKNGKAVRNLEKAGAKIFSRPNAISNYVFSFVEVMGNTTNNVIFRNKKEDTAGKVVFEERKNDQFLQLLLQTLVEHEKRCQI